MKDSRVIVDLKSHGRENRGIYYSDSHRINIFLSSHESVEDLFKTIQHELIHHCIDLCEEEMDEDQEEKLIFTMAWADDFLV